MSTAESAARGAATTIAIAHLDTPLGVARLFGSERGLLLIALPGEVRNFTEAWLRRTLPGARFSDDPGALREPLGQLAQYFAGERRTFDLAIDWRGTPFQRSVWGAVMAVPYGETRTYGEIAAIVGRPGAARAVGAANGANPLAPIVACHRLIGTDGSLRGYGCGLATKRWLLDFERDAPGGDGGGAGALL